MIARKEGGIGWMIFNQPEKHNAVSLEMWAAVPKIVAAFEADPDVRVIVLAGAGERAFVSGADISEFEQRRDSEEAIRAYDAVSEEAHTALARALKPTIAMIRGICFGGGVGIALTTDVRICSVGCQICGAGRQARRRLPVYAASSGWSTWWDPRSPRRSFSRQAHLPPRTRVSWGSSIVW